VTPPDAPVPCSCPCHGDPQIVHVAPCCRPCRHCGARFQIGPGQAGQAGLEAHERTCSARPA
jgi:hypothetical protein